MHHIFFNFLVEQNGIHMRLLLIYNVFSEMFVCLKTFKLANFCLQFETFHTNDNISEDTLYPSTAFWFFFENKHLSQIS
jgi:hypothetical protein